MKRDKKQYIGQRITWENLVLLFPNQWVALKDCKYTGIDVSEGILVNVIDDENVTQYMAEHDKEYEHIERTTEGLSGGYIHAEIRENII